MAMIGLRQPIYSPKLTFIKAYYSYYIYFSPNFADRMSRILSIDYGKKRTGIAVTDPMRIIANGLTTVQTAQLKDFLNDYLKREEVGIVVIGLPTQADGSPSENQARVKQFCAWFKKAYPAIPIEFMDERFTSVLAHRAMIDGGLGKKRRQDKALVDEISATIILQSYMEQRR